MNFTEFCKALGKRVGKKDTEVKKTVKALTSLMASQLDKDKRVIIPDFGTFDTEIKDEKTTYNPQFGAKVTYPKRRVAAFTPAQALRDEYRTKRPAS